jgi:nicotinate phosphoribosyltransferase
MLQVPLMRGGVSVGREPMSAARARHIEARAGLPLSATQLSRGEPVLPTVYA